LHAPSAALARAILLCPARSGRGLRPGPVLPVPAAPQGPKPPASARPAPGGRFSPAGSGAGLCWCGLHGSWWRRSARAGQTHAFPVPARSGAERQNPNRQRRCHGRGHRPSHSATLIPGPPGAQSPRPAPAPPMAGASRPPGRALASVGAGGTGLGGSAPRGRGNALRFLFPPGLGAEDQSPNHQPRCYGRGHRPCHSAPPIPGPPGAQSPRPAPAPPLAGASRPPGRALSSVGAGGDGLRGSVPHGRGKRSAFPGPARRGGVPDYAGMPGISGRGHRPNNSATLTPCPPRPRAVASSLPGRASACVAPGGRSCATGAPDRAGKRAAFPDQPGMAPPFPRISRIFPPGGPSGCLFSARNGGAVGACNAAGCVLRTHRFRWISPPPGKPPGCFFSDRIGGPERATPQGACSACAASGGWPTDPVPQHAPGLHRRHLNRSGHAPRRQGPGRKRPVLPLRVPSRQPSGNPPLLVKTP
jgi:hypothetical protein